ncbi:MAG UNVERIFIED_CONTAM: hypothetical protein LVR18_34005 [Planctomycetaceae bacterium]|jgi:hypothetical protein
MTVEELPENPYAAATDATPADTAVAWHHEFEQVGKRIRCRTGLWLPEICLVSGEQQNLTTIPVNVYAVRKSRIWWRRSGIFLMIAPVLTAILLSPAAAPPPAAAGGMQSSAALIGLILFVGLPLGLALFLIGGRRGEMCSLQGSLQPQRLTWIRRFSSISLTMFLMLAIGLVFTGGTLRGVFLVLAFLSIFGMLVPLYRIQKGLQLRATVDENGVFVISGFSGDFLRRLGELQNSVKQK